MQVNHGGEPTQVYGGRFTGEVSLEMLGPAEDGTRPDIARVDALATMCFLEGRAGMHRVDDEPGYGALAMDTDGVLTATEGFRTRTI